MQLFMRRGGGEVLGDDASLASLFCDMAGGLGEGALTTSLNTRKVVDLKFCNLR